MYTQKEDFPVSINRFYSISTTWTSRLSRLINMFVEKSVLTLFFNTIIQQVTNSMNKNNKISY